MLRSFLDQDGELADQAHRVAGALSSSRGRVVLSCKHANAFMPGLLGAWIAGATVELLPNVQPGTLDRVDADPEVAYVLHDGVELQERSAKALFVPELITRSVKGAGTWPEIAALMSTSGTTEKPRYVAKTTAQLLAELDVLAMVIAPARRVMSTVPLSHFYGMLFGALLPLRWGAQVVDHDALLPADVASVITREHVDLMISTPAHLRAMANAPMPKGLRVTSSGARMPPEVHLLLVAGHGWHVTEILGSTETGGIASRMHPLSGFTPMPKVKVTAPEGQLVVASPWCDAPEVTLGDSVEIAADGTFKYLGRATELLKVAGKRAHAHELEATIMAVPGVTDAAVISHAAAGKEPRINAAIVGTADRMTIAAAVRAQFDAVFVPKLTKYVDAIPRTDRGKIDTQALRTLFGFDDVSTTNEVPFRKLAPMHYVADVPQNLVFFNGHFDAFTILPGAVLVERIVLPIVRAELPELGRVKAIRRLRFRRPVMPDQHLDIVLERVPGKVLFTVSSAESPVANGQFLIEGE